MPAGIHPAVRERARELWEKEGYSPTQIVDQLPLDLANGKIRFPGVDIEKGVGFEKVVLPTHRSTINDWAKEDGWTPHWREARKTEGKPFAISGITDPIWHLAILEVQRYAKSLLPPSYGEPPTSLQKNDSELVLDAMTHVNETLRPGPRVLVRLRPVILHELKMAREQLQYLDDYNLDGDNPPFPSDPMVPNISELWEERLKDEGSEEI
jgi:hypothetical protein